MSIPSLVLLHCADIESSKRFYENFNLSFSREEKSEGSFIYLNNDPRVVFELCEAKQPSSGEMTGLGFRVNDLESLHSKLKQQGYDPEVPVQHTYGQTFEVRDPDGRIVEVLQETFQVEV